MNLKHLFNYYFIRPDGKFTFFKTNDGYVHQEPKKEDYVFGAGNIDYKEILMPNGHGWKASTPEDERQSSRIFDTYGCVSFSLLNGVETLVKKLWNLVWNKSDRHLVVMSDTKPGSGNSADTVIQTLAKWWGSVDEEVYPWDRDNMSLAEYFKEPSQEIKNQGKTWIGEYRLNWESVNKIPSEIKKALQYSPLWCSGYAWYLENGLYRSIGKANHMFCVVDYVEGQYWEVLDQYAPFIKRLAWDYQFGSVNILKITKNQGFNLVKIKELMDKGIDAIMRTENKGQIYELTPDGLVFKDSNKGENSHIPLIDYMLAMIKENKLKKVVGISEKIYNDLFIN